ncbi:hypothetical protein MHBO_004052, partial [Bonamia ostreae]
SVLAFDRLKENLVLVKNFEENKNLNYFWKLVPIRKKVTKEKIFFFDDIFLQSSTDNNEKILSVSDDGNISALKSPKNSIFCLTNPNFCYKSKIDFCERKSTLNKKLIDFAKPGEISQQKTDFVEEILYCLVGVLNGQFFNLKFIENNFNILFFDQKSESPKNGQIEKFYNILADAIFLKNFCSERSKTQYGQISKSFSGAIQLILF